MSEEEKQAIERIKEDLKEAEKLNYMYADIIIYDLYSILNLVEKQQKENEQLKQITNQYEVYEAKSLSKDSIVMFANKPYFLNGWFKRNFISVDKIKAKIEVFKNKLDKNYNNDGDFIEWNNLVNQIEVLQELLEEGK